MSFCKYCVSGVLHEGPTFGEVKKINGVDCYIATPTVEYPKEKVLLYLTDIFGFAFNNCRLLADAFAKNGFYTVVVDYLDGDPINTDKYDKGEAGLPAWQAKHGPAFTRPLLDKVVDGLKQQGFTTFGAVGYCFGARYAVDLIADQVISAAVVSHPSRLVIPKDLHDLAGSQIPILFNTCEIDPQFPKESQEKADEILGGKPFYKRNYYEGCVHGFAVRGDLSDPKVNRAKEDAFKESVEWMQKHL